MILRRVGKKDPQTSQKIIEQFPRHDSYCEPFFGAGGMFFKKPRSKHNVVNDLDSDVYNLFCVLMDKEHAKELKELIYITPFHYDLLQYWKQNKETEPFKKAMRFLFLSNYSFMGAGSSMRFYTDNSQKLCYANLEKTQKLLFGVKFHNTDFEKFLKSIQYTRGTWLVYNDPPYVGTGSNYVNDGDWNKNELERLILANKGTKQKFAISEFLNDITSEMAEKHGLNLVIIGERQTMKSRNTEILLTNYRSYPVLNFE